MGSESTLIDYNFGRNGSSSRTYINNEEFRQIEYVKGWKTYNTKAKAETNAGETVSDITSYVQRGNYLRTALENTNQQNTTGFRGNFFPFCFSSDEIKTLNTNGGYWPNLPRFRKDTVPSGDGAYVGFQAYVCPKKSDAVWPTDYYTLTQTRSNAAWPIRPSNGDGSSLDFSPPKPYFARIRIKLSDLKWTLRDAGVTKEFNILEDESVSQSLDTRVNGEIVELTKIRGFINLVNPDAVNASTNSKGAYKWPHNFNEIQYRVTSDPYGGTNDTPTLTIFNSQCAGNANLGVGNYQNESSYYGAGVPFEIPVLRDQRYLIFDIYTDVCDNVTFQNAATTQWWNLTWSFEGCMYRPMSNNGEAPIFHIEPLAQCEPTSESLDVWPMTRNVCKWTVEHNLHTNNIFPAIYKNSGGGVWTLVQADIDLISEETLVVKIDSEATIPSGLYRCIIVGGVAQKKAGIET